jgi:hypothetical protein
MVPRELMLLPIAQGRLAGQSRLNFTGSGFQATVTVHHTDGATGIND